MEHSELYVVAMYCMTDNLDDLAKSLLHFEISARLCRAQGLGQEGPYQCVCRYNRTFTRIKNVTLRAARKLAARRHSEVQVGPSIMTALRECPYIGYGNRPLGRP